LEGGVGGYSSDTEDAQRSLPEANPFEGAEVSLAAYMPAPSDEDENWPDDASAPAATLIQPDPEAPEKDEAAPHVQPASAHMGESDTSAAPRHAPQAEGARLSGGASVYDLNNNR
jgi:hypothetical protein